MLHNPWMALSLVALGGACAATGTGGPASDTGGGTSTHGSSGAVGSSNASFGVGPAACTNTCRFAGDGECDDGGPNSAYAVCELGTDCADCGTRGGTGSGGLSSGGTLSSGGLPSGSSTSTPAAADCKFLYYVSATADDPSSLNRYHSLVLEGQTIRGSCAQARRFEEPADGHLDGTYVSARYNFDGSLAFQQTVPIRLAWSNLVAGCNRLVLADATTSLRRLEPDPEAPPSTCPNAMPTGGLGACINRNDGVCIQYLQDSANTATSADTRAQCVAENGLFEDTCPPRSNYPTCSATLHVNGGRRVKAIVHWSPAFCDAHDPDEVCASYGGVPTGSCP